MCYNGGTLDYNTCTCKCGSAYSGDYCQTCKYQFVVWRYRGSFSTGNLYWFKCGVFLFELKSVSVLEPLINFIESISALLK